MQVASAARDLPSKYLKAGYCTIGQPAKRHLNGVLLAGLLLPDPVCLLGTCTYYSLDAKKTVFFGLLTTKAQTSLRIRAV